MSAHTPGPWKALDLDSRTDIDRTIEARTSVHNNPRSIARVYGQGALARPDPVSLANARLIAAAPDLLAALEDLLTARLEDRDTANHYSRAWDAVDKAKGNRP